MKIDRKDSLILIVKQYKIKNRMLCILRCLWQYTDENYFATVAEIITYLVESGTATALNKNIYISHADQKYFKCDDGTSAFYRLPNATHFIGNIEELAKKITNR